MSFYIVIVVVFIINIHFNAEDYMRWRSFSMGGGGSTNTGMECGCDSVNPSINAVLDFAKPPYPKSYNFAAPPLHLLILGIIMYTVFNCMTHTSE